MTSEDYPRWYDVTRLNESRACRFKSRADSMFAPRQWETSLQSNAVFRWLGANLESTLVWMRAGPGLPPFAFAVENKQCVTFYIIRVSIGNMTGQWVWHRIAVTSYWVQWRLKSPAYRLFAQPFVQGHIKDNIKAPHYWPLWGEPPVIGGFPSQRTSNAGNVSIWWRHHGRYERLCQCQTYRGRLIWPMRTDFRKYLGYFLQS